MSAFPRSAECPACNQRGVLDSEAAHDDGEIMQRCPGCDDWYHVACLMDGTCGDADCVAIAAEAKRLEAEVERQKDSLLRVMTHE